MEATVEAPAVEPENKRTQIYHGAVRFSARLLKDARYGARVVEGDLYHMRRELATVVAKAVDDGREYVVRYSEVDVQRVPPPVGSPVSPIRVEDYDQEHRVAALVTLLRPEKAKVGEWVHDDELGCHGGRTVHMPVLKGEQSSPDSVSYDTRVFERQVISWSGGERLWERTL